MASDKQANSLFWSWSFLLTSCNFYCLFVRLWRLLEKWNYLLMGGGGREDTFVYLIRSNIIIPFCSPSRCEEAATGSLPDDGVWSQSWAGMAGQERSGEVMVLRCQINTLWIGPRGSLTRHNPPANSCGCETWPQCCLQQELSSASDRDQVYRVGREVGAEHQHCRSMTIK